MSNYLGEKHTFFLSWLSHYTVWLTLLVLPGLALCIYQIYSEIYYSFSIENHWCIYYAILVSIWGTLIVEKWKRKQAELAYKWDMEDFQQEEKIRDDFIFVSYRPHICGA